MALAGPTSSSLSGPADVDIGARPRRGVRWDVESKVRLAQALEDLFECSRVDLVVLPQADPFVAVAIIRGERLLAEDEHEADEYAEITTARLEVRTARYMSGP